MSDSVSLPQYCTDVSRAISGEQPCRWSHSGAEKFTGSYAVVSLLLLPLLLFESHVLDDAPSARSAGDLGDLDDLGGECFAAGGRLRGGGGGFVGRAEKPANGSAHAI